MLTYATVCYRTAAHFKNKQQLELAAEFYEKGAALLRLYSGSIQALLRFY
jgi:hypothetical protein